MNRRQILFVAAAVLLVPSLSMGAGFALFEHGNRGMAMGGAMTPLADDLSAMFWNVGGLAFQTEDGVQVLAGATLIKVDQDFTGSSPYPGDGYTTSQKGQIFYPAHFYLAYPINDKVNLGFSFLTPFGLGTYWDDDHAGRWISKRADLKTFNLSPNVAFKLGERVGIGVGVDYMIGTIDLTRNLPFVNPYTQEVVDIGQAHMYTDSLSNAGWGWHAGLLAELGGGFSFGLNYRSAIEIDFEGLASFTQFTTGYADLDYLISGSLPFDENAVLTTSIDYPSFWTAGLAWSNETISLSFQYGANGWSSFQELPVNFRDYPELDFAAEMSYEDTKQYRLGFEYRSSDSFAFQAGAVVDETPQPISTMSPLLGDGDRIGLSIGASFKGEKFWADFGYMYLMIDGRSTEGTSHDGYDGTYEDATAHLLGASLGYRF